MFVLIHQKSHLPTQPPLNETAKKPLWHDALVIATMKACTSVVPQ